jgi:hypothetical protein
MKRLLGSSWKHIAQQLGLLGGIAAAFVITTREEPARADDGPECPSENECTLKEPNIMLVMDYSTSMNGIWDHQNNLTRWQVVVASIKTITQGGSYLSQDSHLARMRCDGAPSKCRPKRNSGPPLATRRSPDVPWYDAQNDPWYECNGAAIGAALDDAIDPITGSLVGIGTWTEGALDYAKTYAGHSIADPPDVDGERTYLNVVVTDGAWTCIDGMQPSAAEPDKPSRDENPTTHRSRATHEPRLRLVERPPSGGLSSASPDVPNEGPPLRLASPPPLWMPHRSDLDPRLRLAA